MPKIAYVESKFTQNEVQVIIDQANEILEKFAGIEMTLTLRQLYYQFVKRNWIRNKDSEYKRLGDIVSRARLRGQIDWLHITDRTRYLQDFTGMDSTPQDAIRSLVEGYNENLWADQDTRVEVWIEKDALSGVFERPCAKLNVGLFACKGYTSQSEMWAAAQRLIRFEKNGKNVLILYFGDHDPSGVHMTEDIQERLNLFGSNAIVKRCALNMDQIKYLKLPPQPGKVTDSRFEAYREVYGSNSWELDALDPEPLWKLVETNVLAVRNKQKWAQAEKREERNREILEKIAVSWEDAANYVERQAEIQSAVVTVKAVLEGCAPGQQRSLLAKSISQLLDVV